MHTCMYQGMCVNLWFVPKQVEEPLLVFLLLYTTAVVFLAILWIASYKGLV